MSSSLNNELYLAPNDSFEIAFGKLEKIILDNEQITAAALTDLKDTKLDSSVISAVGLSNDYNDLSNRPNIPANLITQDYVDTSIITLKDYVDSSLKLSSTYVMSSSLNNELYLSPNDSFETAFGKLEKAIIDNEEVLSLAILQLDEDIKNSSGGGGGGGISINATPIENVSTLTSSLTIDAYKIYQLGTVSQAVTITFDTTTEISGYSADYTIVFTAGNNCSITLPNTCLYCNGVIPTYVNGRTYEINISNNLVVVSSFYTANNP